MRVFDILYYPLGHFMVCDTIYSTAYLYGMTTAIKNIEFKLFGNKYFGYRICFNKGLIYKVI